MRTIGSSHVAMLAIAWALGALLMAPMAGQAKAPVIAPALADNSATQHVMGTGGLGSAPEETIIALAPVEANEVTRTQHVMGSGGLGSPEMETIFVEQPLATP
jgi:hypothetical protein